ncbi:MAG: acetate kinase [bacterium]
MKILVLNCGSSSVKFRFFDTTEQSVLVSGMVESIGKSQSTFTFQNNIKKKNKKYLSLKNHRDAIDLILTTISCGTYGVVKEISDIDAVGHRVVHGGETFTESVLINEAVYRKIKACIQFAPLHNPPNIEGIKASLTLIPYARQVAVFDTAFHQTMEPHTYIYALPYNWYKKRKIRRYGFHGTSHNYVAHRAAQILGESINTLKIITCHLGNGASITAVDGGKSVDTSMGFTPLEGLVMGTRCGDIAPAIPLYIIRKENIEGSEMDTILNKQSGLAGITEGDSDLRTIECKAKNGSERHILALQIFTHRVKKYIGSYAAVMGGVNVLVFTAGIGENSSLVRSKCCEGLEFLGISIDEDKNIQNSTCISNGNTDVLVIPTNEEQAIVREVEQVIINEKQYVKGIV